VLFFSRKSLTWGLELVINSTSSKDETRFRKLEEVNKMMEFMLTMTVIALIFVAATILVALVAGGLMKAKNAVFNREAENTNPE
jgi:hypothetical protein